MKPKKLLSIVTLLLFTILVACKDDDKEGKGETKNADAGTAKNIETTRSFYPLFEKGDWAGIEKITSPEFMDHNPMMPPGSPFNRDSLLKYLRMNKEAFPDMKFEILHTAGNGDMVFVHYRFTGTNSGPFMGNPASNKKVDYNGVDLIRIKDNVAVEHWDYADNMTYMTQMGFLPGK